MSEFDGLQRGAFAGFDFPIRHISVKGGLRDHVHEYPHSPGGAPEKLGRKLYQISIDAPMHDTLNSYPLAYSKSLPSLQIIFEGGRSFDLTLPNLGTITAYCVDWDRDFDVKRRSGEDCKWVFREDQSGLFLVTELIVQSSSTLALAYGALVIEAEAIGHKGLFDSLKDFVNGITALSDQVEAMGNQIQAQLEGLTSLCEDLDHSLDILNKPVNAKVLDAFHDTWSAAAKMNEDILKKSKPKIPFVVPALMPIGAIAASLYGDASRGAEILQIDPIDDAFAIPAGKVLSVYAS